MGSIAHRRQSKDFNLVSCQFMFLTSDLPLISKAGPPLALWTHFLVCHKKEVGLSTK